MAGEDEVAMLCILGFVVVLVAGLIGCCLFCVVRNLLSWFAPEPVPPTYRHNVGNPYQNVSWNTPSSRGENRSWGVGHSSCGAFESYPSVGSFSCGASSYSSGNIPRNRNIPGSREENRRSVGHSPYQAPSYFSNLATSRNEAMPQAASGTNLHQELDEYYRRYVDVDAVEMQTAQNVVDDVVRQFEAHLRSAFPQWHIGDLTQVGSTTEGLKVIAPDEFDFMVPVGLDSSIWKLVDASHTDHRAPGFWLIKEASSWFHTTFDKYVSGEYLSPAKIRSGFQQALQKMANQYSRYTALVSVHGPSVTLEVRYDGKSLSIDFVPTVSLEKSVSTGRMQKVKIVGKPHPMSLRGDQTYDTLWRRSFSTNEGQELRRFSTTRACHAKCLKILKAARVNSAQLGMLSSYELKTVLLHQMAKGTESHWSHEYLQQRFVDLVVALSSHVKDRRLPHFFTPEVNLFAQYNETSLNNLETYLAKVIRTNDFASLLRPRY